MRVNVFVVRDLAVPLVKDSFDIDPLPEFESKITEKELADQSGYSVTDPVPMVSVLPARYVVPEHAVGLVFVLVVHHPAKV